MITNNRNITIIDITDKVCSHNQYINNCEYFISYDILNNYWYEYDIYNLLLNILNKFFDKNQKIYCISEEINYPNFKHIDKLKFNKKLKKIYYSIIEENINKTNNNLCYLFECLNKKDFINIKKNISLKPLFIIVNKKNNNIIPKEIHNLLNFDYSNNILTINKKILEFLESNKATLIRYYNDSNFYDYRGEAEGIIIFSFNKELLKDIGIKIAEKMI